MGQVFMKSVVRRLARALGYANVLDHVLDFLRRGRREVAHDEGDGEVDQHADETNSFGRNTEPIVFAVGKKLKINDVARSESDSGNHSRYGSLFVYSF